MEASPFEWRSMTTGYAYGKGATTDMQLQMCSYGYPDWTVMHPRADPGAIVLAQAHTDDPALPSCPRFIEREHRFDRLRSVGWLSLTAMMEWVCLFVGR